MHIYIFYKICIYIFLFKKKMFPFGFPLCFPVVVLRCVTPGGWVQVLGPAFLLTRARWRKSDLGPSPRASCCWVEVLEPNLFIIFPCFCHVFHHFSLFFQCFSSVFIVFFNVFSLFFLSLHCFFNIFHQFSLFFQCFSNVFHQFALFFHCFFNVFRQAICTYLYI